jgi:hypothetical protein
MAKEYVYLEGKGSWIKHLKPDEKYNKWSLKLHPTAASLEKIRDMQLSTNGVTGIKNTLGKDEDGYFMSFSRPTSKLMKGSVVSFTPPLVVNKDGSPYTGGGIGNGSDVTIKLEVYTHKTPGGGKARACRWEGARIDNLIEYAPDRDLGKEEYEKVKELVDQPTPKF